jgi:dihydropteroate synthase
MGPSQSVATWLVARGRRIDCACPVVMAILNLTPDSFSDGGAYPTVADAVHAGARAVEAGAAILDLGGESTRPGAATVDTAEQIARVVPVVRAIRSAGGVLADAAISIDTTRAAVARAAIDAGADAINDVSAGMDDPEMLGLVAERGAGIVLMHRLRAPAADSYSDRYREPPFYEDVVSAVREHLMERVAAGTKAGVGVESIVIDPGLGFGKTVEQNLELVARTGELVSLGRPVVSGASRKSFVGRVSTGGDTEPWSRLAGSIAMSVAHRLAGASIFRVHDVAEQMAALRVAEAVRGSSRGA